MGHSHPNWDVLGLLKAVLLVLLSAARAGIFWGFSPWFYTFLLSPSFRFTRSQFKRSRVLEENLDLSWSWGSYRKLKPGL